MINNQENPQNFTLEMKLGTYTWELCTSHGEIQKNIIF